MTSRTPWTCRSRALRQTAAAVLVFAIAATAAERLPARWISAVDGDTVVVAVEGRQRTVRLLGVDTPEVARKDRPGEPFSRVAAEFTRQRLSRAERIELEIAGDRVDAHGRTLGFLWVWGPGEREPANLSEELLRAGLARAIQTFEYPGKKRFLVLEAQARRERVGMWRQGGS